jgi:hypothetical protein
MEGVKREKAEKSKSKRVAAVIMDGPAILNILIVYKTSGHGSF